MPKSISFPARRIRAALLLRKVSVPQIARKHGAKIPTVYAVLNGKRPVREPKAARAVEEMERIAKEVLRHE